jgi:hypothetical protein
MDRLEDFPLAFSHLASASCRKETARPDGLALCVFTLRLTPDGEYVNDGESDDGGDGGGQRQMPEQ